MATAFEHPYLPIAHQKEVLTGTLGLPMPEHDAHDVPTPDPFACMEASDGDSPASGHATPTYSPMAGRGLYQKLCRGVSEKLRCMQEQQKDEAEERDLGSICPESSEAVPPSGEPRPRVLPLGDLLPPPKSGAFQATPTAAVPPPPGLEAPQAAPARPPAPGVVSIGSLGHPFGCGGACKYQRRKGGCMLGVSCQHCHLCQWNRKGKEEAAQWPQPSHLAALAAPPPSPPPPPLFPRPVTSGLARAHADTAIARALFSAGPADAWQEEPAYVFMTPGTAGAPGGHSQDDSFPGATTFGSCDDPAALAGAPGDSHHAPSLGSIAHPHGCGRACKYARKAGGCKVGFSCDRCHLCRWTRSQERAYAAGLA